MTIDQKAFIDEFMDRIYLHGTKDDGKYVLTLSQAEAAAAEFYQWVKDDGKEKPTPDTKKK
ncbi:MAG: hypothetical protein WCI00_00665 [bacterium]